MSTTTYSDKLFDIAMKGGAALYCDLLAAHVDFCDDLDEELAAIAAAIGKYWIISGREMPAGANENETYATITNLDDLRADIEAAQREDDDDEGNRAALLEELTFVLDRLETEPRFEDLRSGKLSEGK